MNEKLPNPSKNEKRNWHVHVRSEKGRRRENQDNFLVLDSPLGRMLKDQSVFEFEPHGWPETHIRLAVADGMGGHMNGRQIAETAIATLAAIPPQHTPEAMRSVIYDLHDTIRQRFPTNSGKRPGTTLVLADVEKDTGKTTILNVGDSRAYIGRPGKWRQLTRDHLAVEFALRDGEIGPEEYVNMKQAGSRGLVQALGYGSMNIIPEKDGYKPFRLVPQIRLDLASDLPDDLSGRADAFELKMDPGDILLLATDGLWRSAMNGAWRDANTEQPFSRQSVNQLVHHALQLGSTDNITVAGCMVC